MDNRKAHKLEPVTETPEVRAARAAHERAWQLAAKAAGDNPDPMSDIYNANANKLDEEQSEYDQAMEIISGVANQQQALLRYPNLPYDKHIMPNRAEPAVPESVIVEAESRLNNQYERIRREEESEVVEQPSEPRGFFYNFDYPVQLIVENQEPSANIESKSTAKVSPKTKRGNKKAESQQDKLSNLDAEVVQYKLIPIEILDSKKSKRSGHRRRKSTQHLAEAESAIVPIVDSPLIKITKTEESQPLEIPVEIKIEEISTVNSEEKQFKPTTEQKIVKIKTSPFDDTENVENTEAELKRLATNAELIDAVHDAQIHPKQV